MCGDLCDDDDVRGTVEEGRDDPLIGSGSPRNTLDIIISAQGRRQGAIAEESCTFSCCTACWLCYSGRN